MVTSRIDVDGLKPLLSDLRRIDRDLPKTMRRQLLPVSQTVLHGAQSKASGLGGVHAHAARRGLRAGATQNTAWIRLLGNKEPTILGAEFGGGRRSTTRQFPPWRGANRNAGYFVYPTIRDKSDDIVRDLEAAVRTMLRLAGFR